MCWKFSEIQSRKWRDKRILKRIDSNVKKVKKTLDNDNESELFSKFLKRIDSNVKSIKMTLGKKVEQIQELDLGLYIPEKEESANSNWSYTDQDAWKKDFKVCI